MTRTHPIIILLLSLTLATSTFDADTLGAPAPKPTPRANPEAEALNRDLSRLPDATTCRAYIAAAEKHLLWIDGRIALFPADRDEWSEYRMQVTGWLDVWQSLLYAHESLSWSLTYCREKLERVRDAIGEEAWRVGYVPPPFAVHGLPHGE